LEASQVYYFEGNQQSNKKQRKEAVEIDALKVWRNKSQMCRTARSACLRIPRRARTLVGLLELD